MTMLFPDTSPTAQRVLIDGLRSLPPWRKLRMMAEMNAAVHQLAMVGLRERYPDADDAELCRGLAELLLGAPLAAVAYGPLASRADTGVPDAA